jgi:hypothetical protein
MPTQPNQLESSSRTSRFIAEALVGRHGPGQITARASEFGIPKPLTKVIVAACTATATDMSAPRSRRYASAAN